MPTKYHIDTSWADWSCANDTAATWTTWTTATATSSTIVWNYWVTTSDITTSSSASTWGQWIVDGQCFQATSTRDERTAEQRQADDARFAAERQEIQRRADEEHARRLAATEKARALLLSMLDTKQKETLHKQRFFEVVAKHSRRRYRIHHGTHGNVRLLDDNGREVTRYCGQPTGVPTEDSMLAQKLQIEHDEAEFVRLSNATRLTA
jgi:hypothetical protein